MLWCAYESGVVMTRCQRESGEGTGRRKREMPAVGDAMSTVVVTRMP